MKSFWKFTLATLVGLIIFSILNLLIWGGIISALSNTDTEVEVKNNSVLLLKLDAPIVDRAPNDPFSDMDLGPFSGSKRTGLNSILDAIEKAKENEKIKGIYINTTTVATGFATSQEIHDALMDFKESGKFIFAYSDIYDQKAYYLASVADKVYLNPEGMLDFSGLASSRTHYKGALDKLGIEMQVVKVGKFKSAVEPFIMKEMSPENREQTETYLFSLWNNVLKDISISRNVAIEDLNKLADKNIMFNKAAVAKEGGLVDDLLYEDQVIDALKEAVGISTKKKLHLLTVSKMKNVSAANNGKGLAKNKIAVIYASGEIKVGGSQSVNEDFINSHKYAKEIRNARKDSSIKAVVLRINSPGGSALGSDIILREVKLTKEVKPVIVSMGDLAASGGYYIACAADTIVALPTTLTGSIGIFGLIPNAQKLMEEKLGLTTDVVKTNAMSDKLSLNRPMTEKERILMQTMVENGYDTFIGHVAEGRNMTKEQVNEIGQGRVWSGENAISIGLVDVLGNLDDAIAIAKEKAQVEDYRLVSLPKQKDPFEEFINSLSNSMGQKILQSKLGNASKHYQTLQTLTNEFEIMARMPYDLVVE